MVELDWVFKGESGKLFLDTLANATNDDLFKVSSIKYLVTFLWSFYFPKVLVMTFLPYLFFFFSFIIYASITYIGDNDYNPGWRFFFALISIGYCGYSIGFEIIQAKNQGSNYLNITNLTWNFIDITSTIGVLGFVICDLSGTAYLTGRVFASLAVLLVWSKLFYFLRIFT